MTNIYSLEKDLREIEKLQQQFDELNKNKHPFIRWIHYWKLKRLHQKAQKKFDKFYEKYLGDIYG
jgi:hypothetical protein